MAEKTSPPNGSEKVPVRGKSLSDYVIFECTPRTLESVIIADNIGNALPEAEMYDPESQLGVLYNNFKLFMGMTSNVEFNDFEESPGEVKALQVFWDSVKRAHGQWEYLWSMFRQYITLPIHDLWLDSLMSAQKQTKLFGPREIWPLAPDFNEDEDPKGPKSSSD